MRKRNYLSNHDLLEEIHKSKGSFCSWLGDEDHQFDSILPNIDKINIRSVAQAKRNRADRIAKAAYKEAYERGDKVKQAEFAVDWKKIDKTEVVFRIMTYDHVPLQPGRKKTIKTVADSHVQLNFPPFQHWRYDDQGELICVGKSHWEGGLENGWFNKEHGTLTNKLVRQFMKLIQRYAQRSNWRYYTYNDEMQGTALLNMSQMCLKFDESKSQNPFAYYTAVITNSFTRVLNTEKKGQKIRDDILEANGLNPSYTRQYENEESKTKEAKAEAVKT
tara:strand:+ start:24697 stop:25524 length:828 start_codon:yes stop_codon:yes gene_type:complete